MKRCSIRIVLGLVALFALAQVVPYGIEPWSWLIYRDSVGGRGTLDFSEWRRAQDVSAGDVGEAVRGGSMPPWYYTLLHPKA